MEISTPPPKLRLRARLRADFERMLLEAAQDRMMREDAQGTVSPWRKRTLKRFFLGKLGVPAFRLLPWGLRRWMMRMVCGYPKGWPRPR